MHIYQTLGFALICGTVHFVPLHAHCSTGRGTLIKGCVNAFVLANNGSVNQADNITCLTDKLTAGGCNGYTLFKACLGEDGRTGECVDTTTAELKESGMPCTFNQIQTTCDGSIVGYSLMTVAVTAMLSRFY